MKTKFTILTALLLTPLASLYAAEQTAPSITLHISPTGDDANPGTKAAPFATPSRAHAAVRDLLRADRHGTRL